MVALVTAVAGLACAALLDRAGHPLPGLLACALTGLLISPISWDHHWVWIVPGVAVAAAYAVRATRAPASPGPPISGQPSASRPGARGPGARGPGASPPEAESTRQSWPRAARWPAAGYWGLAAAMLVVYGAWPGRLWGEPNDLGQFSLGVIWQPPSTDPEVYYRYGDRPWFAEYHWHGIELLTGNAFLLGGLALLAVLIAAAPPDPPPEPLPHSHQPQYPRTPLGPHPPRPVSPTPVRDQTIGVAGATPIV